MMHVEYIEQKNIYIYLNTVKWIAMKKRFASCKLVKSIIQIWNEINKVEYIVLNFEWYFDWQNKNINFT